MAKIMIEPGKAKNVVGLEASLEDALRNFSRDVESVQRRLRQKISGEEQISARLREAAGQLDREANATRAFRSGLEQIIQRYEQSENGNRDLTSSAERTAVQENAGSGGSASGDGLSDLHDLAKWMKTYPLPSALDLIGPIIRPGIPFFPVLPGIFGKIWGNDGVSPPENVKYKSKFDYDIKKDNKDKGIFEKKYYKDLETGKIIQVDENDPKAKEAFDEHNEHDMGIPIDLRLASLGLGGSAAIAEGAWEGHTDWGGHEGSVSAGKVEGNIDGYVGWGLLGAELGAGLCVFSAEEKGYLGNEDTQLYGKVNVDAGKLEGKAGVSVGIVDKTGEFNPSFYAGASAEAIAGEVGVTLGGKALGTDVSMKASVNYGLGAHANFGLHDGKISVDLGATVGVGFSVKLDIDVSGTISGICDGASKVWSGVTSLFHW